MLFWLKKSHLFLFLWVSGDKIVDSVRLLNVNFSATEKIMGCVNFWGDRKVSPP